MWRKVDNYFADCFFKEDKILEFVLENCQKNGLPDIQVSSHQGMLLHILAKMQKAKKILEIGTLGGYSSIHMARALDDEGHLTTIEYEEKHAKVAAENFNQAGLSDKITLIHKDGKSALNALIDAGEKDFDFVFIDADKPSNSTYLELSLKLAKKGAVIICDNIVREGHVIDAASHDEQVQGARQFCENISHKEKLITAGLQTVGSKGYDGFSISFVM